MSGTKSPRQLAPVLIVLFCIWHMGAVAFYNLPKDLGPTDAVRKWTDPYVLLFSQWQQWDIFSPDPLRRVSHYIVERNAGDRWETTMVMSQKTLPWWMRAKELKILGRISDKWKRAAPTYLLSLCANIPYSEDRELRLTMRSFTLPADLPSLTTVSTKRFSETAELLASARCPRT